MTEAYFVLIQTVIIFLDVISIAMLIRAILSWVQMGQGQSAIGNFLYVVTEPFIMPLRALFDRFGWFKGFPLDVPFFITVLLLSLTGSILSSMVI